MRIGRFKVADSCWTQSGVKRCRERSGYSQSEDPSTQKHRHQHNDTHFLVFEVDPHQNNTQQTELYLRRNVPRKIIAPIFKPIIDKQKSLPPTSVAYCYLILVLVPHWTRMQGRRDLPVDHNGCPVDRKPLEHFLIEYFEQCLTCSRL